MQLERRRKRPPLPLVDQARLLESVADGAHSRRQIDRELSYFLQPGTQVLVHDPNVKGRQLTPKSLWWVVRGIHREQLVLWSQFTHAVRKSKLYTAFKLARGLSYQKFLSLKEAPQSKRQKQIPVDLNEKFIIKMQRLPNSMLSAAQKLNHGSTPPITVHQATESAQEVESGESRGIVTIFDELGSQLTLDKENGELNNDDGECCSDTMIFPCVTDGSATGNWKQCYVDCMDNSSPEMTKLWDSMDAANVKQ